jgi:hypothetical protein
MDAIQRILLQKVESIRPLPQYKMREELRNYFDEFKDRGEVDGERVRSLFGFQCGKIQKSQRDRRMIYRFLVGHGGDR